MNTEWTERTEAVGGASPPNPGWWKASDGNWYPPAATDARSQRIQVVLILAIAGGAVLTVGCVILAIFFNVSVNANCQSIYGCRVKPGVATALNLGMVSGFLSAVGGGVGLFIARAQK